MKRILMGVAAAVAVLGAVGLDARWTGADAQPCGYPPWPPCRPYYYAPPPPPPPPAYYYAPPAPPPPPAYYYGPGPRYYGPPPVYREAHPAHRVRLGRECKVKGPNCRLWQPLPVGSYCQCGGRPGIVAED